jgi:hypothetical protein
MADTLKWPLSDSKDRVSKELEHRTMFRFDVGNLDGHNNVCYSTIQYITFLSFFFCLTSPAFPLLW